MKKSITVEHEIDICDEPGCSHIGSHICDICLCRACMRHSRNWDKFFDGFRLLCPRCFALGKTYQATRKENDKQTAMAYQERKCLCSSGESE